MPYISTFDRNHLMLCSWDTFVEPHSIAILIDAFVNSLNLKNMKEKKGQTRAGRPMIQGECISCIYMVTEKEFVPHENWRKVAKSIWK